jgi:hypothetical protein
MQMPFETFWLLIAVILVDAVLCIVLGILWIRVKSMQRFGVPSDSFADDSYTVAERDGKNFQARGLAILIFIGVLVLSLCGLWQFGLFDDLAGVSLALVIQGEAPLWLQSDDLDREQVRDSTPFAYRTAGRLNVVWRLAILSVALLGFFVCSYLDSKLPDGFRVEFLEMLGLKGLLGVLPFFMIVLGLFIILIAGGAQAARAWTAPPWCGLPVGQDSGGAPCACRDPRLSAAVGAAGGEVGFKALQIFVDFHRSERLDFTGR